MSRYEKLTDSLRGQIVDLQSIQGHLEEDLVQYRAEIARHAKQCDEALQLSMVQQQHLEEAGLDLITLRNMNKGLQERNEIQDKKLSELRQEYSSLKALYEKETAIRQTQDQQLMEFARFVKEMDEVIVHEGEGEEEATTGGGGDGGGDGDKGDIDNEVVNVGSGGGDGSNSSSSPSSTTAIHYAQMIHNQIPRVLHRASHLQNDHIHLTESVDTAQQIQQQAALIEQRLLSAWTLLSCSHRPLHITTTTATDVIHNHADYPHDDGDTLASVSFLASAVALACNHTPTPTLSSESGGEGWEGIGVGEMTHPVNKPSQSIFSTPLNPLTLFLPPLPPCSISLHCPSPLSRNPYPHHPHLIFRWGWGYQLHPHIHPVSSLHHFHLSLISTRQYSV